MTKSETLVIVGTGVQTNEEVAIKLVSDSIDKDSNFSFLFKVDFLTVVVAGKCEDCATPGYIVLFRKSLVCADWEALIDEVTEKIEKDLVLLGATTVEDKL